MFLLIPENMVPCGPEELRCRSGQCVPVEWQCDGEMDCPEGLDEWDVLCSECRHYIQIYTL